LGELHTGFDMTLTGLKKHVHVLEEAGLVSTRKIGRVRHCRLGPKKLENVTKWMSLYRDMLEERLDHLQAFLESNEEVAR
jgi:DNA-binding transcriptional ArsR family regulator